MKKTWIVAAVIASMTAAEACASPLVYTGSNPEITPTANPNNEAAIQNFANISKPQTVSNPSTLTEAQLLKESVISGLSSNYQQLLTAAGNQAGTVQFGDGSYATYSTSGNTRTITFYDLNGQTTTISFPLS